MCGGSGQIFPINARSLRDGEETPDGASLASSYKMELRQLGINADDSSFFYDTQKDFVEFVRNRITKRMNDGSYQRTVQTISYCTCGRVELPTDVLESFEGVSRLNTIRRKIGGGWECIICGSELKEREDATLTHYIPNKGVPKILPLKLTPKAEGALCDLADKLLLVSRTHRRKANDVCIGETVIDPDHCWMHYLDYLSSTRNIRDFTIVIGINTIPQAMLLCSFTRVYNPEINITFLVTPLIDLNDRSMVIHKKTGVSELIKKLGSIEAARVFLSLSMRWNNEVSKPNFEDIRIIGRTLKIAENRIPNTYTQIDMDSFIKHFNRQSIVEMMKEVRQGKKLDGIRGRIFETLTRTNP